MVLTFLTLCALLVPAETESDASLYRRAVAASERGNSGLAAETFALLLRDYPESELGGAATLYLAEHFQRSEQHLRCYNLISDWQSRITLAAPGSKSSLSIGSRLNFLLARSAVAMAASKTSAQEKMFWVSRLPCHVLLEEPELSKIAIRELAKSALVATDSARYAAHLDKLFAELRCSEKLSGTVDQRRQGTHVAFETQARFAVAEALTQAKRYEEAEVQWVWLREKAKSAQDSPDWMATVYLRSCECLLAQKEHAKFQAVLEQSRGIVSERVNLEIRLLESRWLQEQVEFSRALKVLRSVTDESGTSFPDLHAEAWWRAGELLFLQKNYSQACVTYERAIASGSQIWLNRTRMQRAKCLELAGRFQEAQAAYEELLLVPEEQYVELARSRLDELAAYQQKLASSREQVLK